MVIIYILVYSYHLFMLNNKKDFSDITDDLHLGSAMDVRLRTGNMNDPKVVEILFNCCVIPTKDRTTEEYEKNISHIRRKFSFLADGYIQKNQEYILDKKICDIAFSIGNLKKGYNKSVTFTLFIRQRGSETWTELKRCLRKGLGEMIEELTEYIRNEGFSCKKSKKVIES